VGTAGVRYAISVCLAVSCSYRSPQTRLLRWRELIIAREICDPAEDDPKPQ